MTSTSMRRIRCLQTALPTAAIVWCGADCHAVCQEDRIGSFGGFEDTEAKPVHHKPKAEEDTMQDELKAIEGK